MKCEIGFAGPAVAVALALVVGFGCSKAERQEIKAQHEVDKEEAEIVRDAEYRVDQWDEAVRYANKGYDQLDEFDTKYFKDEPRRARMHLEKAAKDFRDALTHFAKCEVGEDRQGAVNDLNAGVDALDKAYKEFDEGRVDAAQSHYDTACEYFAKAETILLQ